jgi:hypothetical protein
MDVKGKWDLPVHRAYGELEQAGGKSKTGQMGFRYYVKSELMSQKQGPWTTFKALVMMLVGKTVMIEGKECIIGRRSFEGFKDRMSKLHPELKLKSMDIQQCINKLRGLQRNLPEVRVQPDPKPGDVQRTASDLARRLTENSDPAVRKSSSLKDLARDLQEVADHPNDAGAAARVEEDVARVEQQDPEAANHVSVDGAVRQPSEGVSREEAPARAEARGESPKSTKQQAMERLSNRAGGITWGTGSKAEPGLRRAYESAKREGKEAECVRDIMDAGYAIKFNKKNELVSITRAQGK